MFESLKPYPEVKNSGVEWLGKVPVHWKINRLKSLMTNVTEPATNDSKAFYLAMEHIESWTGRLRRGKATWNS